MYWIKLLGVDGHTLVKPLFSLFITILHCSYKKQEFLFTFPNEFEDLSFPWVPDPHVCWEVLFHWAKCPGLFLSLTHYNLGCSLKMDCLYFHLEKAFRLKDSDLHVHFRDTLEVTQLIQFMHICQVINFLTEIFWKNMMYLPLHLFFGVYRKGEA